MTATAPTPLRADSSASEPLVLLVVPPFQGLGCPALGVSQLKGNLVRAGYRCEVLYINLSLADRIGGLVYEWLSGTGPFLLGDLIFAPALTGKSEEEVVGRYAREVLAGSDIAERLGEWFPGEDHETALLRLAREASAFVREDAMREILGRNPWMVGFSSTFLANCSSLAMIKELKRQRPEILTVMGGANCEAEMGAELRKCFDDIDFVGRGECDRTFVDLIASLRRGEPGTGIRGFLAKGDAKATPPSAPLHREELDGQAFPDFEDYFAQLAKSKIRHEIRPGLAMETSRGCWWGAKQHCTFCAFNREGMVFRSKSPDRAVDEINTLATQYGMERMEMTDNILDMAYFKSLVPQMAEHSRYTFFWETKANLSEDQVRMMRRAGIRWIQPGIESLSDLTLKLMRKGSTQLQNTQLLKWCTESGVRITWNWLFGFPGEDDGEMDDLVRTVETIHHLQPPSGTSVLYLERFAPYHTSPEEWGLTGIKPSKAYKYVYGLPDESLNNMAFFFECDHFEGREQSEAYRRLREAVRQWKEDYRFAHLVAIPRKRHLVLLDTRSVATRFRWKLRGLERRIYEACGRLRGVRDLERELDGEATTEQITGILQRFVDHRLVLQRGDRYLAVATDPRFGYRDFPVVFPGGGVQPARKPKPKMRRIKYLTSVVLASPKRAMQRTMLHSALKWGLRYREKHGIPDGLPAPAERPQAEAPMLAAS